MIKKATSLLTYSSLMMALMTTPQAIAKNSPADGGPAEGGPTSKQPQPYFMLGADRAGDRLISVGELGAIMLSVDQGNNWQTIASPVDASLTSVYMQNESVAWAVGHDATILKSVNGGKQWDLVYSDIEFDAPLFDIWFRDGQRGLAVGAYGLLLKTTDGGNTWRQSYLGEDDYHLFSIIPDDNQVYLTGEMGMLYSLKDSGDWETIATNYEGSLFSGVLSRQSDDLTLFSMQGNVIARKQGEWSNSSLPTASVINHGFIGADQQLLAVGADGVVLAGGSADSLQVSQLKDRKTIADALLLDDNKVLLVGEMGVRVVTEQTLTAGGQ